MEKKKKILIVEDDIPLMNTLREKLSHEGFEISEAKNGEEGLEVALRELPDIILLDIIMPVMDGLTMLKKLRGTNDWAKHVPVIILTNLECDTNETIMAVTETQPSYYLVKINWTLDKIVTKIRERLGK